MPQKYPHNTLQAHAADLFLGSNESHVLFADLRELDSKLTDDIQVSDSLSQFYRKKLSL